MTVTLTKSIMLLCSIATVLSTMAELHLNSDVGPTMRAPGTSDGLQAPSGKPMSPRKPSPSATKAGPKRVVYVPYYSPGDGPFDPAPQISEFKVRAEDYLHRGETGGVIRVKYVITAELYALKYFKASYVAEHGDRIARMERLHSKIQSDHVVEYYCSFLSDKGAAFYVMELVEGQRLSDIMRDPKTPPLGRRQIVNLFGRLIEGIHDIHQASIAHRDISPGNIIITSDQDLKIIDFGLACEEGDDSCAESQSPTPYRLPEAEAVPIGRVRSADYYSAGIILIEMFKDPLGFISGTRVSREKLLHPTVSPTGDEQADHLVHLLCDLDAEKRWEAFVNYEEVIKKHPFFENYVWDAPPNVIENYKNVL